MTPADRRAKLAADLGITVEELDRRIRQRQRRTGMRFLDGVYVADVAAAWDGAEHEHEWRDVVTPGVLSLLPIVRCRRCGARNPDSVTG